MGLMHHFHRLLTAPVGGGGVQVSLGVLSNSYEARGQPAADNAQA